MDELFQYSTFLFKILIDLDDMPWYFLFWREFIDVGFSVELVEFFLCEIILHFLSDTGNRWRHAADC